MRFKIICSQKALLPVSGDGSSWILLHSSKQFYLYLKPITYLKFKTTTTPGVRVIYVESCNLDKQRVIMNDNEN